MEREQSSPVKPTVRQRNTNIRNKQRQWRWCKTPPYFAILLIGAAATNLLYAGEQFDIDAQQYYLRVRYYDPLNGRFNRADPFAGSPQDPQSLHKYLYAHRNRGHARR